MKNTWMDDIKRATEQRSSYDRYMAEAKEFSERKSPVRTKITYRQPLVPVNEPWA